MDLILTNEAPASAASKDRKEEEDLARAVLLPALVASVVSVMVPACLQSLASPPARQPHDRPLVGSLSAVRAEKFELLDQSGATRAWLGSLDDGAVVLAMRDQEGTIRVLLIADAIDTGVALSSDEGRVIWKAP